MRRLLPLLAAVLVLTGCGTETSAPGAGGPSSRAEERTLFAEATVLEGGGHGPQLCLGGVMESYPPQCGGPDVLGWDWDDVGGFERASGTTWGQYVVIGTYDQDRETFTPTEAAVPAEQYDGPRPGHGTDEPRGTP